uniref:Uncharacterized protein n=1 Tax=Romanomermis culicivorax TaxID=13658 RepID=A0A915I5K9_ROMCU
MFARDFRRRNGHIVCKCPISAEFETNFQNSKPERLRQNLPFAPSDSRK